MHLSHLVNENTVIDAKVQLITTVFLHIEKRAWRYFVVYSLYIHARASLPSVWRGRYKNAAYRPIHYRTHYTSNMSEDHIHNAINVISLSCTLIYPLQMSLEIWKVGQLPTEIGRSKIRNTFCRTRSLSNATSSFLITWRSSSSKSAAVYKI